MSETGTCLDCKYNDLTVFTGPCEKCNNWSKWEPKEDDMENENRNATATIDTEAELRELKAQVAKLQEELEQAKLENAQQMKSIEILRKELARDCGTIEGLKFAIRCNGVSGGEV